MTLLQHILAGVLVHGDMDEVVVVGIYGDALLNCRFQVLNGRGGHMTLGDWIDRDLHLSPGIRLVPLLHAASGPWSEELTLNLK